MLSSALIDPERCKKCTVMPVHFDEIPCLGEMQIKHDLLRLR